ncbi:hypothetical protein AB0B45_18805 [Nonomuraea sp. NPDC049152]|uniref:hypothetical protein n=1 Tax=Nonomuraea sp. NPDC049152 TaxID=3154350 RepID=UPI0033FE0AA9
MSNAVRHVLGVVAGLLLTPLLAVALTYGVGETSFAFRMYVTPWPGALALAACAIVLGFVAGSRLSPIASLLAGLTYTLAGLGMLVIELYPAKLLDLLPSTLRVGFDTIGPSGLLFMLGVLLLTASAFPSRWRAARPRNPSPSSPYGSPQHPSPSSPYGPPPQQPPSYPSAFTPYQPPDQGDDDQTRPLSR